MWGEYSKDTVRMLPQMVITLAVVVRSSRRDLKIMGPSLIELWQIDFKLDPGSWVRK